MEEARATLEIMEIINTYFEDLSSAQTQQFALLGNLYTEWNEKINVISRKDMDQFYTHHVLHSLAITTQFSFFEDAQVLDLGAGGGFPGLPLAIFYPHVQFTLADSVGKKLKVAADIASQIGLTNLKTRHTRAEDIKDVKFDSVVSRAVAPLKDLLYWSRTLIKKNKDTELQHGNGLICLKGGDLTHEIFESGRKPYVWEVAAMFPGIAHFEHKYLIHVPV